MSNNHFLKSAVLFSSVMAGALTCAEVTAQAATTSAASADDGKDSSAAKPTVQEQQGSETKTLDTVVVTGLGRKQGLQSAPNTINVLDGATLRDKGSSGFRDYLTTVPGVNFTENNLGASRVTIRGISDGIGATDPLSTVYIDEMPITQSFGGTFDPALYDVERVEVLKGPQGTLYGAGSMGGTVRVVGKKPRMNTREFTVDSGIGGTSHGGTNYRLDGVVNTTLAEDLLALRVSVGTRKDAGWIDDVVRGQKDGNSLKRDNVRAQLLLQPSSDTSVTLGLLYQKDDVGLPWYEDTNRGEYQTARIYRAASNAEARATTLTVEHDWASVSLLSATNYLVKESTRGDDSSSSLRRLVTRLYGLTLGDDEGIGLESQDRFKLFTQEVRLTSTGKRPLDWVVGGYYSNATAGYHQQFDFAQAPTASAVVSGPGFYDSQQSYKTRQTAAFGELTYHATDKLAFTVGLRASDVKQHNLTAGSGTLNGGVTTTDMSSGDRSSTKKLLTKYQADKDHMLFASASQGYRNGGPTGSIPVAACGADAAALGYSSIPNAYKPDQLWNYEVGSKNTYLDGKLNLNASLFRVDWDDIQTSVPLTCGFTFITNAGKARSTGVELEVSAQPASGLTVTGAVSYVDAKLVKSAAGSTARAGDELPLTSKWTGNLAFQYSRAIGGGYSGFFGGDISYVGDRWTTFQATTGAKRLGDYTVGSIRLGVRKDNWSISAFVNNVGDTHYATNENSTANPAYRTVGRPRTFAVNAKVTY